MRAERLRAAMATKNVSQSQLARDVGISQGAIAQLLSGQTARSKYLSEIADRLEVSARWLLGETEDPAPTAASLPNRNALIEEMGLTPVKQLDIGYAMGGGSFIDENVIETKVRHFDSEWLQGLTRSSPDLLFIASGTGDSMIPTLMDNDTLLIDRGQQVINQQDRIWAIAYGELGMVKRVRRLPSGSFLIISDNPAVQDFEASPDEMFVIGRLIWIGRRA
jgi:phage repressor protein C with HTH and peptisase S24 domain